MWKCRPNFARRNPTSGTNPRKKSKNVAQKGLASRRDQGRPVLHRLLAQALLHRGFGVGELIPVVDPHHLFF